MKEINKRKFLNYIVAFYTKFIYSNEFKTLLKKKKRCFKYFKYNYRLN